MSLTIQQTFDIFAAFPEGLAVFELVELMDNKCDRRNASARLSQFMNEGLARKQGAKINPATGQHCTIYVPTGKTFDERALEYRPPTRKRKRPTDSELIELRQWKADAIKRFPELGVDPLVLKARQHIARIMREEGRTEKAALAESGELDDSESMRIVLGVMTGPRLS